MAATLTKSDAWPVRRAKVVIPVADIVALGAAVSGTITLTGILSLPPKAKVLSAGIFNNGVAAATLATLTAEIGDAGDDDRYLAGEPTIFAANAGTITAPTTDGAASNTADTVITVKFTGNANLSTLTGLTDGVALYMSWLEA